MPFCAFREVPGGERNWRSALKCTLELRGGKGKSIPRRMPALRASRLIAA